MLTTFYDIALGLMTVLLLAALGWSVALRRKVKEQTEKIRQQLLRESALEKQYSDLFENANDMIFTLDTSGNLTSLNKAGERITGYTRAKVIGMSLREFVVPEQHQWFDEWIENCKAGTAKPQCEVGLATALGRRSVVEVTTCLIERPGNPARIEGIARDITNRKQAEEALRQSEERFSSAFHLSPVAIALSTVPDGRFIDVNDSFLRMFDFSRESVVNRTAGELGIWENPEDIECVNEILKKQRSICGMECKFRTRSGASRMALVFIERIELSSSPCAIFITHDITDRLGLETQLRKAQKLEAVGQLAAGVAHDFNNLLTVIQGHAELAMMEDNLPAALIKSLETVSTTSRRAANLTRQLLTFSRQQSLQPKPLNLNEVLNDLLKMVKHLLTNDVGLKTNYAAHLPVMRADLTMIEQVVMNLAVNARDAMPQGGTLLIETQSVEIDEAYVQKRAEARPGHFVCLTVRDTGCGMDLATQARIFEPFFTTKEVGKGTGLGLATVYGIVKQHKGWLELTSEVGQGTTFKIFFPGEEAVPGAKAKTAGRDARPGPATVLVVEDEAAVCELVRTILQSAGFRVLHASNAMEAMQLWNEHRGEVDLVFTDMVMPRGMSGRELAANLLALKPDLKIVYTTGYSRDVIGHDLELQEGHNFLPKPHAPPKLIEMIRTRLNSHEPARLEA